MSFDRREALKAIQAERKAHSRPLLPRVDQTSAEIEAYYRIAPLGSLAAVRQTQFETLLYKISKIDGRKRGRVYIPGTRDGQAFNIKSGTNCFVPTGKTRLVVPTQEVVAWAADNPLGRSGASIRRNDDLSELVRNHALGR